MSRRRIGPILYGLMLYAVLLAAWQVLVVPRLPEVTARVGTRMRDVMWVESGMQPFPTEGDLTRARTIFVGDSRIWAGICLEYFDAADLGPCGLVWGAAANLSDLLAATLKLHPQRVVLGISALSLKDAGPNVAQLLTKKEFPNWRDEDFDEAYAAWHASSIATLKEAGFTEKNYAYAVKLLEDLLLDAKLVNSFAPRGIDARLARWADDLRQRSVYTLQTSSWNSSWFVPMDLRKHDKVYKHVLSNLPEETIKRNLDLSLARVRALRASGIQVVCVRIPADAQLLKIENHYIPPERFARFCREANVPYLDHSRDGLSTRDGAHLTLPAANEFSRELATELANIFNQ